MKAVCDLCFHRCALEEGQTGFCRARANVGGGIISLNYGRLTSLALDPIEKKPLRRFMPGSMILSAGSFGCNLRCAFCQNYEISMAGGSDDCGEVDGGLVYSSVRTENDSGSKAKDGINTVKTVNITPKELVRMAQEAEPLGNVGLAYTYNEPLVGYEFVRDCACLIHEKGMKNVLVTNGTVEEKYWRELLPLIDAVNIDLKGFTPEWYRRLGGDLETVKRSIEIAAGECHVEVTTLVVPGENDSTEEIRAIARWLGSIDSKIPLHISRFFPRYLMTDIGPLQAEAIYRLVDEAESFLSYVYPGNC